MRIGFIGDLHIDYNTHHDFLTALAQACDQLDLDTIVFCGDTLTGAEKALSFYGRLQDRTQTRVLQIPGNHELYCLSEKNKTSLCLDADEYMDLMLNDEATSLFKNPIVHGQWCIIGGPSWYDYSLHRNYRRMDAMAKHRFLRRNPEYKYLQNTDQNPFINEKITARSLMLMERQLRTIRERAHGKEYKICSAIHMLPLAEMYKSSHVWATTVAFMGSKYYAELYESYGVDLCICAHSHIRRTLMKNGTTYVNVSLGHNFKWKYKTDLLKELLDTIYVLDI
ncbi:metallophosphoesterase [Peptococcus simiae]|uniref:Metallophosphoesterase n=1 Tax=Peptococcus simiae TaxID=1643805 RepID=A0ABW9H093_9FIRM